MKFTLIAFIAALGFTANSQKYYSEEATDKINNILLENKRRQYVMNSDDFNGNYQNNNRWILNSNILKGSNEIILGNQYQKREQTNQIQEKRNRISQKSSRVNQQNYEITGLENAILVDDSILRNQFSQSSSNSNSYLPYHLTNLKNTEKNQITYIPVWFDDQVEEEEEEEEEEASTLNHYNYYPTQELYSSYRYPYASSYYSPKPTYFSPLNGWQQSYLSQHDQESYYSNYYPFMRRHLDW